MKIILGLTLIFISLSGFSKLHENQFLYLNAGVSAGNFIGGQTGIGFAVDQKYSLQLEYSGVNKKANSLPSDFNLGLFNLLSFRSIPMEKMQSLRLMFGLLKPVNKSGTIRVNLKAGFSFLTNKEPYNWRKMDTYLWVSNYEWDYKYRHLLGVVIKPDVEFVFSNYIGISASPYLEISGKTTIAGVGLNIITGKLRTTKSYNPEYYP